MNIALDYDGTYTSAPELWLRFVIDAQAYGHEVFIVTMRYPSEILGGEAPMDPRLLALQCVVIATSRKAKRPHCEALPLPRTMHVWIDDNPEAITMDAAQIWPDTATVAPEGRPLVPEIGP